ncbi:MAG: LapA family protein [Chloroflexi bacterium]|nr:lipopolysaccharide assembly protein LapA domain-containing protein [Anaerolineaceae bacterium]NMB90098.1 LapA family protein [Chloroflexota bacterium]
MQIFIVIALVIAILAVVFALQNLATVTVTFFIWSIDASLALVLLVTLAVGVLISLLASLPGLIRGRWTVSGQKKKLAALEAERNTYQQKAEAAEKDVKLLEEQMASLSAALETQTPDETPPAP